LIVIKEKLEKAVKTPKYKNEYLFVDIFCSLKQFRDDKTL